MYQATKAHNLGDHALRYRVHPESVRPKVRREMKCEKYLAEQSRLACCG
jgi:hypothetical protein